MKKQTKLPLVVKKWIAALRSGKYKQGQFRLHTIDDNGTSKFCCLGVACDLAVKAGVINKPKINEYGDFIYNREVAVLPKKIMKWLGIKSNDGSVEELKHSLIGLNDSGWSFKRIASYIEKNWHLLSA
jgi:hypothetical protein